MSDDATDRSIDLGMTAQGRLIEGMQPSADGRGMSPIAASPAVPPPPPPAPAPSDAATSAQPSASADS